MPKAAVLLILGLFVLGIQADDRRHHGGSAHPEPTSTGHHDYKDYQEKRHHEMDKDDDKDDDKWNFSSYKRFHSAWKITAIVLGVVLVVGVFAVSVACCIVCRCKQRFCTTSYRSSCGVPPSEKYKTPSGMEKAVEAGVYAPPAYDEAVQQADEVKKF
ncbi:uncharacterized protein LOC106175543 [Lingula anatina]|uniref:Uncharacterized protein LOC106175543 n=1 Tax=Lingula anatina TaxID=7574 RepID=A0A1S3JSP2_LINAN|nr:uncharacterized protein LOC106175543 [Lingula anatina]|eukprot:XP_013413059.1 uncharacterized protein LOC106175543 [Lingula anatina]